ncbi:hypothetical protein PanWU01x14_230510 [Parasponia andersonii]|uniref:Uncharacterized protein n=1 Tax=Parasponia andersonii TaxID=3476 RepID=A0A2P5BKQ7_PARAD|nr:hypothetical protein PanWU01x14_230510 [Parasponia andersonii]
MPGKVLTVEDLTGFLSDDSCFSLRLLEFSVNRRIVWGFNMPLSLRRVVMGSRHKGHAEIVTPQSLQVLSNTTIREKN